MIATVDPVPHVLGQPLAQGYFARAIAGGRLSHAYLFAGAVGIGKRTFADGLARLLLCRTGESQGQACGECVSCRTFDSGNHGGFSVISPERGKSIEIDRIREAIASLALRSSERRVVVLDPADAMPVPAANALLKTLEEPPAGIMFILVTARPAQLLGTIHSRAHRVPFGPLDEDAFREALRRHDADPEAYPRLHAASGGAPGLALRLLEAIEACGGPDRYEALLEGVGADRPESLVDFVPDPGDWTRRDRVRELITLVVEGHWRDRDPDPDRREALARRAVECLDLERALDGNVHPDLVLEQLARRLLRR